MLRIAEARMARGWSQEQLAQAVGTTQQTIQRWESGQTDPQVSKLKAVSKALGITMTFLLDVDNEGANAQRMSADEQRLIGLYRDMSSEYREMLMKSAVAYAAMTKRDGAGNQQDVERAGIVVR